MVYGHKQASKHTHARAQCSHAIVGLAQARPKIISVLVNGNVQTISACKELYFSITFILLWHSKSEGVLGTHFSLMHGSPGLLDNLENP